MKTRLLIYFLFAGTLAVPRTASAVDPSTFLKVLNVDINKIKRDFVQVKNKLGSAERIDTGDAASYEGRVEYILRSRKEMLTFFITECTRGYRVRWVNPSERSDKKIMKPNVQKIEVGGLYLGMKKDEIENIFIGTPSGGWVLEENKKTSGLQKITYKKTIGVKGNYFCDRIWLILKFDKQNKLSEYDVEAGGCDDHACEGT